jgi:hypothetical protein
MCNFTRDPTRFETGAIRHESFVSAYHAKPPRQEKGLMSHRDPPAGMFSAACHRDTKTCMPSFGRRRRRRLQRVLGYSKAWDGGESQTPDSVTPAPTKIV